MEYFEEKIKINKVIFSERTEANFKVKDDAKLQHVLFTSNASGSAFSTLDSKNENQNLVALQNCSAETS